GVCRPGRGVGEPGPVRLAHPRLGHLRRPRRRLRDRAAAARAAGQCTPLPRTHHPTSRREPRMSEIDVRTTSAARGPAPAPAPGPAPSSAQVTHNVPLVFTSLLLGMLIVSLGQMIFATALPTIVADLGGVDRMSWVITVYLLTMTIGLPVYGKLGDQIGRASCRG